MFHLMTHAFFKALLFMAAGSVIAAMAEQPEHRPDERLPARRCRSPRLHALIGGLALAAFPLTSGFFSKDEILAFAELDAAAWYLIVRRRSATSARC